MKSFSTLFLLFAISFFLNPGLAAAQCVNYPGVILSGSTVCYSNMAMVTVANTSPGITYQAYLGSNPVGTSVLSSGSSVILQVPSVSLNIGKNIISLQPSGIICPANIFPSDTALVVVNDAPKANLTVVGDTVCTNHPTATIIILNSEIGVRYRLYTGLVPISESILSNGGDLTITVATSLLNLGQNTISVVAMVDGCGLVNLINRALIIVHPQPVFSIPPIPDQVLCQGTDAKLVLTHTGLGTQYEVFLDDKQIGDPIVADGKDIEILIPAEKLMVGNNTVRIQVSITSLCGTVQLVQTTNIRVNPTAQIHFEVLGDTVTLDEEYATLTIMHTDFGMRFYISNNKLFMDSVIATSNTIVYKIPVGNGPEKLGEGLHTISVTAMAPGCNPKPVTKTAIILVKPSFITSLNITSLDTYFKVWPNPILSDLHITMKSTNAPVLINIVNAIGAKVFEQEYSASPELIISPEIPNGVYFLEISSGNLKERIKLIK